jgi:prolyl oligopeptidase
MYRLLLVLLIFAGLFSCQSADQDTSTQAPLTYPETKSVDTVTTYFGTAVADPYRWLEDDMSEETGEWVKAQNNFTFRYLQEIPFRDALK